MIRLVYIAGPFSGDELANTVRAMKAGADVHALGVQVFCPHSHGFLWNKLFPQPEEVWKADDIAILQRCDAVYRLSGESKGSDEEGREALYMGIPVFRSLEELGAEIRKQREGAREHDLARVRS